jgi:predicted Zn finger-like uncharacterized protein
VIVTCERCTTQFQLDASRLPAGGSRVRCSRCKHAFVVTPPGGAGEDAIHRAASDAARHGATPDVTRDLPGDSIAMIDDAEEEWQFNDERRAGSADGADPNLPADRVVRADTDPWRDERFAQQARNDAERSHELGSPADWDIFDDVVGKGAGSIELDRPRSGSESAVRIPLSEDDFFASASVSVWLRRAGETVGWLATVGLCAVALLRGLSGVPAPSVSWPDPMPDVAFEGVRGRWLEHAALGGVYVVSGRLRNTGTVFTVLPTLAVELRDASGKPVGVPVPLAEPVPEERLRHASAAELAGLGLPRDWALRAGESREFEAVAWPLPGNASRFAIRVVDATGR